MCVVCDSQTVKNNEFLKSFLDYCEKFGDIRSGFDYTSGGNDDDINSVFEDIKFQRLKISENKSSKKEVDTKNKTSLERIKKAKTNEPVTIDTPEDKLFQEEVLKLINQLKNPKSEKKSHEFSSTLNPRQRRIVHELGEKHNLCHESKGENEQRYIVLSVITAEAIEPIKESLVEELEDNEEETTEEVPQESNRAKKKRNRTKIKKVKETASSEDSAVTSKPAKTEKQASNLNLLGEYADQEDSDLKYRNDCTLCSHCGKYILKVNYLMHELHCSKLNNQKKQLDNTVPSTSSTTVGATSIKTAKNDKIKKNPIENAKTDDFDELLEMFQKSNNVCNFKGNKQLNFLLKK